MTEKIDSNITGLAFAEEETIKVLPGSPIWQELEPNSYSDFGGEITNVARTPIDPSRQRKKGTISDLDASGGFNADLTQTNLTSLLQGFFFADAREKVSTDPLNGTKLPITATTIAKYQAASGLDAFKAGCLIFASNFADSANNGLKQVTAAIATEVDVVETLVVDASPSANSKIEECGFNFASGDIDLVVTASSISMTATVADFTTHGLNVGEWIFVGDDNVSHKFANNELGFARIKSIAAKELVFDDTTFTAVSEVGTGLEIRIFFGTVIRNEKESALIKRRTYNLERQLGSDDNGVQSEYLEGAVPNEFTLNIPQTDKINADMTFVATDNSQRNGTEGLKTGTRVAAPGEEAFNTSSDVYRMKLSVIDPDNINPDALFGFVSEATIAINNNATPNKAIGVLGAFEVTVGDFETSGSLTAFFSEIEAVKAVRNNCDVGLNTIVVNDNAAVVFDIPLLALSNGKVTVEKDAPIVIPLDQNGAECEAGYTMSTSFLPYVPIEDASC